jgi:hypothetical protein
MSLSTTPSQKQISDVPRSSPDFSKSNLILMIGGQILLLVLALMIVYFGMPPLSFPANAMRNAITRMNQT